MALRIGDEAPDFTAETTAGTLRFHEWIGDGWAILFSHPKDFTPVCTTELGSLARISHEFARRRCRIVGLSVDSVADHLRWTQDIADTQGAAPDYPLIGDTRLEVAKLYDMIHPNASGTAAQRSAADNATIRSVFVIGPDKRIKAMLTYPMSAAGPPQGTNCAPSGGSAAAQPQAWGEHTSTGRNFDEVLRVLDSVQLTAEHNVATPANWRRGDPVIIVPSLSDDEARQRFPGGWHAPKPYLRIVPQPA